MTSTWRKRRATAPHIISCYVLQNALGSVVVAGAFFCIRRNHL